MPMVCKPLPWTSYDKGGYILWRAPILRHKQVAQLRMVRGTRAVPCQRTCHLYAVACRLREVPIRLRQAPWAVLPSFAAYMAGVTGMHGCMEECMHGGVGVGCMWSMPLSPCQGSV